MRSGISQLISIWNGNQASRKRTNHIHAKYEELGPGPPPEGPDYSGICECGRGGKARIYLICNDEWICEDCSEDLITGGFSGRDTEASTPPPPPDEAPCDLEEAGYVCNEDRED